MAEFNQVPTVQLARSVQPIANSLAKLRGLSSLPGPRELPNSLPEAKEGNVRTPEVAHEGLHTGPIHSPVAGRTDHLPAEVPNGSYVLPADIVSALGEGNTMNGFRVIKRMFSGVPGGGNAEEFPYGGGQLPYGGRGVHAAGGQVKGVPVVIAGGEHVLKPEEVSFAGHGDMDLGHRVLDQWVRETRAKTIKTLQGLPGPRAD